MQCGNSERKSIVLVLGPQDREEVPWIEVRVKLVIRGRAAITAEGQVIVQMDPALWQAKRLKIEVEKQSNARQQDLESDLQ
jgi:hypothetical protein